MRTGDQHHAGTESNQRYCIRQLGTAGSSSQDTRDRRGTKWLDQWIIAEAEQPAADERADRGTGRDQQQARRIERTENDAKRSRAKCCEQSETWRGSWRKPASRLKRGLRSLGRQRALADLIDHRRDGQYPSHVDTERLGGNELREGRAIELDDDLAPVRHHATRHAESAPKPLGSGNRTLRGLPVSKQERGCQRGRLQCRLVRQRPEARCFPLEIGQL